MGAIRHAHPYYGIYRKTPRADPGGVEPATSWSPVGRASNWATEAGNLRNWNNYVNRYVLTRLNLPVITVEIIRGKIIIFSILMYTSPERPK